jgi:hypothetical protein
MTWDEIREFPTELQKALRPKYRVLSFEIHSGPLIDHVEVKLGILGPDGMMEAKIPLSEFSITTESMTNKVLEDLHRLERMSDDTGRDNPFRQNFRIGAG